MSDLPAWAEGFADGTLAAAPPLRLPGEVTREWAYGDARGVGVSVAVIDSGIDEGHPEVGAVTSAVVIEADSDAEDGFRLTTGPHEDLFGHGTACAAIIRGLAPAVELHSVRVLGARLTGKSAVFARGLEWCIDNGMHVVNLSLSTSNDDAYAAFHELCDQAAFAGVVLVSALANERKASYPSEFSSVFSVAAAEPVGRDRERILCNPKPPAEWGAAGIDVEVAWAGGSRIVATGNSFAAPVIAGHAARILGAHPGIAPFQVKTVLAALADNAA